MARILGAKCKQCRREGQKLFLKGERCFSPKCAIVKRNYPPGVHGPTARIKHSDYGVRLREKQKAKRIYRILERQFRNYFVDALKEKGKTGENLLRLVEQRFDNVIYRAGFAGSRDLARQLVGHGHFLINGQKVNIPSYLVKSGDVITLAKKSETVPLFAALDKRFENYVPPGWLNVDVKEKSIKVLALPDVTDVMREINVNLIVEFYSR